MPEPRRRTKSLPVYPTRAEVYRILAACDNDRDRLLVELLWHTGGRISEVLAARVGDITKQGIKLTNLKQNTPSQKHVFLHPTFLARLQSYAAQQTPDSLIIGRLRDGKHLSRIQAWRVVTRAGLRAGVVKQRFGDDRLRPPWCHSFRHGNAVHLLENQVPISAVQAQLGHSSLSSTEVYTRITDQHRQTMIAGVTF